jgi:hypothetical protein
VALRGSLYDGENWTGRARGARRITAGCTGTDYKANVGNGRELNVTPILDKIQGYR